MLAVVVFVGGKVEEEVAGGRGGVEGIANAGDGDGGEDIAGGCDKGYRCEAEQCEGMLKQNMRGGSNAVRRVILS